MRTRILAVLVGIVSSANALSVEEAYRLIPHQRMIFRSESARMPIAERAYLAALFSAVDQAIVAKVSARRETNVANAYQTVWKAWEQLNPPTALKAMQDKVKAAILDQQTFLLEVEQKRTNWNMNHQKVRSSSARLQDAHSDLVRIYPRENATNKQAFFDYLCALDFV